MISKVDGIDLKARKHFFEIKAKASMELFYKIFNWNAIFSFYEWILTSLSVILSKIKLA